jgi:hypothetical protein
MIQILVMWLLSLICFKEENHQGNQNSACCAFSKITSKGKDALPVPFCLINNQLEHLLK